MEQVGRIIKIEQDKAIVEISRSSACGDNCHGCNESCSIAPLKIEVENSLNAKLGDYIELAMDTTTVMKLAFFVYIIPIFMMIIGVLLSLTILKRIGYTNYEIISILIGILCLGIFHLVLKKIDKEIRNKKDIKFRMSKIL